MQNANTNIVSYTKKHIYKKKKNRAGPPAYLVSSSCHISIYSKGENKHGRNIHMLGHTK